MSLVMHDKGYDFPLYSLDRIESAGAAGRAAPSLAVPGARLAAGAALLRRAARVSSLSCEDAVALALGCLQLAPAEFRRVGFDGGWAASMRHWRRELMRHEARARALAAAGRGRGTGALVEVGGRLWARLALSARMAGRGPAVLMGRAPRQAAALRTALGEAAARAEAEAATLARYGFGPEERADLAGLLTELDAALAERPGRRFARRAAGAELLVLRAALLGDAALLLRAAPQVLPAKQRRALSLRDLLRAPRRVGPASPAAARVH